VPLAEEFQQRPDLLSATNLEDRIKRLVGVSELPVMGRCLRCGVANSSDVLSTRLDCERSTVHREGGLRFLYIPFLFWMLWEEEERVEVRGHDTNVPAPVCVCGPCQQSLRERKKSLYMWLPLLLIPLGSIAAFFHLFAGLSIIAAGVVIGFVWIHIWQVMASRAHQNTLKNLLCQIPVYRQMLASYPHAFVVLPPDA
jgi:hypothetical protein